MFIREKRQIRRIFKSAGLVVLVGCLLLYAQAQEIPIDGIVAVVDEQVITLTDLKIALSFGLYHSVRSEEDAAVSSRAILESLIDQKVVVLLVNPGTRVHSSELEQAYQDLIARFGAGPLQQKMAEIDLSREELLQYLEELITYRRILGQRFQQSVGVSLKQIEDYYENIYVPAQRANGMEPSPMLDILKPLESAVIAESTRNLTQDWLGNLRDESDILIFADQYPQFFNK